MSVIRSILHTNFREPVEAIVQLRSRVQAEGNLVFTKAVLLAAATGSLPDDIVQQSFIGACQRSVCVRDGAIRPKICVYKPNSDCQAFLQAAQAAVTSKMTSFGDDSGLTQTFNQAAREYVTVLTNGVWMNFVKWQTKLIYSLLQAYDVEKSYKGFVTKSLLQIINRAPNGPNPNMYKSDRVREEGMTFLGGPKANEIVKMFEGWMSMIPDKVLRKNNVPATDWDGIACKEHIISHLAKFLYTGIKIVEQIEVLRDRIPDDKKMPTIPQVIPQLCFKLRCVTFGVEQTTELCAFIEKKYPDMVKDLLHEVEIESSHEMKARVAHDKHQRAMNDLSKWKRKLAETNYDDEKLVLKLKEAEKKADKAKIEHSKRTMALNDAANEGGVKKKRKLDSLTLEHWRSITPILFPRIFVAPDRMKNVSVVTTDGISASWHKQTQDEDQDPKKKKKPTSSSRKEIKELVLACTRAHICQNIMFFFVLTKFSTHIQKAENLAPGFYGRVGEDCYFIPGPQTTVIGIDPGHANVIVAARKSQPPGGDFSNSHPWMRLGLTSYTLKNTTWRDMNGNRQFHQRVMAQGKRHGIPAAASTLATCSSRSLRAYDAHVSGRLGTSDVFKSIMKLKNRRRWKFESYQKGQRAVHKLAADVLEGVENKKDVVIAWGDGSFGPTSRGHHSAPNKKLLRALSHLMPIVLADEYGTSKHSCCCLSETDEMKTPSYRKVGKRATVVKCKQCKTMLSRDFNASVNIVEAFIFLNATRTHSNQFRPAERNMQTEARGTTN